ncbi:hypothetical protein [Butyrivibrio sp. FCS006]|nr:hypothetical protein [Butyrivibrio sp. FCS006]
MEMFACGVVKAVVRIMGLDLEVVHQAVLLQQYLENALVARTGNINLGGK